MRTIRVSHRRVTAMFAGVCVLLVLVAPAWAQEAATEATGKTSWVLPYTLTVLGVGLGLVGICRPGRRTAELRRRDVE